MWAALHPCLRRAGSPVDGLWPTRCEPCRHRTARFDRLGESGRLKIDRDDTLSDGSARDSATRRSRPRVETRPIDAGRASLETEPDDRVPRCGREAPPFTAGEDVTRFSSAATSSPTTASTSAVVPTPTRRSATRRAKSWKKSSETSSPVEWRAQADETMTSPTNSSSTPTADPSMGVSSAGSAPSQPKTPLLGRLGRIGRTFGSPLSAPHSKRAAHGAAKGEGEPGRTPTDRAEARASVGGHSRSKTQR
ncbi:hypothetical protein Hlac_1975 [Halorubrum lacusprofundi ATCC 49239]|uniref:Uncharacterized protein n=2 Tax=Halorubrum lacusprofundi TaxID=2247 RepID=B9LQD2_HALLT|nr:hypothetical protein Hlac_1975 [Halorubrum lacusprofundi ATCC 49239]